VNEGHKGIKAMAIMQVEVNGTLRADGTLELDEKPGLPAGRVKVLVQSMVPSTKPEAWAVLERIWAERKALGLQPRAAEDIDAEINAMRDEWEEHQQGLDRFQAHTPRAEEKPGC
jgi:hypothetical protein